MDLRKVCALTLAACAVTTPAFAQDADPWFGADKALHFSVSAGISGAAYGFSGLAFTTRPPRFVFGVSLALAAGVGKELYDLAGYGDPSWRDLAWDALGAGVGVLVAWLIDLALEQPSGATRSPARRALTPPELRAPLRLAW